MVSECWEGSGEEARSAGTAPKEEVRLQAAVRGADPAQEGLCRRCGHACWRAWVVAPSPGHGTTYTCIASAQDCLFRGGPWWPLRGDGRNARAEGLEGQRGSTALEQLTQWEAVAGLCMQQGPSVFVPTGLLGREVLLETTEIRCGLCRSEPCRRSRRGRVA